jgi:hypothetical protein
MNSDKIHNKIFWGFLGIFLFPFVLYLEINKIPLIFYFFKIKKFQSHFEKFLFSDLTIILNYAVRHRKFPKLFSGFHFWTFFLSNFKNPKILLRKKCPSFHINLSGIALHLPEFYGHKYFHVFIFFKYLIK